MKLQENHYYHIYHRGVNKKKIVHSSDEYSFLLDRIKYYLFIAVEIYAYCLLNNHFHLLIRVRSVKEQRILFERLRKSYPTETFQGDTYPDFKKYTASSQIGHFLNSYTKYFNRKRERTGVLFDGRFKRIEITGEDYLTYLICYIHRNPIHHRITDSYESYPYSSFNEILSTGKTIVNRKYVLELMGGKENFYQTHEEIRLQLEDKYLLED